MSTSAWRGRAAYVVRRGGVPAWLGAGCLLAALVFLGMEVLPASAQLADLRARRVALAAQQARGPGLVVLTPAQQLARFYAGFSGGPAIPDALARLYQIATEQQLALELGEYAITREQGARLDQFRITLPVKGSYLQLRRFISAALLEQPALSLESLSVRREKVAQDMVDGRIVFLLYLEHAP